MGSTTTGWIAAWCLLAAGGVHASCKPLIDAYEKGGRQQRTAMYSAEPGSKLGTPLQSWLAGDNRMDVVARQMREGEQKGATKCAAAGAGSLRGAKVEKFAVDGHPAVSGKDRVVVWVDSASGLPAAQEMPAMGMFLSFQYGDAVK